MAAAQAAHANDPDRAELLAKARRFKASWFELGEALTEARRSGLFKSWGFATFEDYCKRELHLKQDTADKLTGSFSFLRARAPEVLSRDAREAPIPSYQAVDFWRQAEEAEAPEETVREIRRQVLDEGASLPKLSRLYREVVFPVDEDEQKQRRKQTLKHAVERLVELLALARDEGAVPKELCAEVEEPLARLVRALVIVLALAFGAAACGPVCDSDHRCAISGGQVCDGATFRDCGDGDRGLTIKCGGSSDRVAICSPGGWVFDNAGTGQDGG